jgi:hypothetical protein
MRRRLVFDSRTTIATVAAIRASQLALEERAILDAFQALGEPMQLRQDVAKVRALAVRSASFACAVLVGEVN